MPLIVHSPYSGRPVKIRDEDVGRALRDEEGRIFYAVPRSDGRGYYGSPTRKGSEKDEQRYLALLEKGEIARETGAARSAAQIHDATGPGRPGAGLRKLATLVVILFLLAAIAYVVWIVFGEQVRPYVPLPGDLNGPEIPTTPTLPPSSVPEPQATYDALSPAALAYARAQLAQETVIPQPVAVAEGPTIASALFDDIDPEILVEEPVDPVALLPALPKYVTTASGLKYRILTEGAGPVAEAGKYALIHYTTKLPSGAVVDTSHTDNPATDQPIGFVLWAGQVIRGWDEGIAGMRVGEVRELVVPQHLIRSNVPRSVFSVPGSGDDPESEAPDADAPTGPVLHFDIELVDLLPGVLHETLQPPTSADARQAGPGDTVEIHYLAAIDGVDDPFDDSYMRNAPLRFRMGRGDVILGLELGVRGMRPGERRLIVIPPYLAYGQRGIPGLIPPNTALRYEIELLRIVN